MEPTNAPSNAAAAVTAAAHSSSAGETDTLSVLSQLATFNKEDQLKSTKTVEKQLGDLYNLVSQVTTPVKPRDGASSIEATTSGFQAPARIESSILKKFDQAWYPTTVAFLHDARMEKHSNPGGAHPE